MLVFLPIHGSNRKSKGAVFLLILAVLLGIAVAECQAASPPVSAKQAEFGSVGLEVVPVHGGELVVLSVLPGMPAAVGGLKPGDLILTVDGFPLRGSDFSQVVRERLWGRVGSQVTLVFLRPGEEGRRTVVLRRAPLPAAIPEAEGVRILIPGQGAGTQEKKP